MAPSYELNLSISLNGQWKQDTKTKPNPNEH